VHGIIYVVDGADLDRLEESKETLTKTLESEGIPGKPVLIFANKQDLPGCISSAQLSERLGLLDRKDLRLHVTPCQAKPDPANPVVDQRISKGLRWLLESIDSNYKTLNTRVVKETEEKNKREKEKREEQKRRAEASKAARLKEQAEAEAAAAAAAAQNSKLGDEATGDVHHNGGGGGEAAKQSQGDASDRQGSGGEGHAHGGMAGQKYEDEASNAAPREIVVEGDGNRRAGGSRGKIAPEMDTALSAETRLDQADDHGPGGHTRAVKAPAKLEIDGDVPAAPRVAVNVSVPRSHQVDAPLYPRPKLPSLDMDRSGSPSPHRGNSPGPRLNDLKPMPPVQVPLSALQQQEQQQDVQLPNAIPSPAGR
jgi:hypothetical protein